MTTTVFITGGAGYVGSVLCQRLKECSMHVRVLDNFRHGVRSLNHLLGVEVHRGDCRDRELLSKLIKGVDVVIPLAALVGMNECAKDKHAAYSTNVGAIRTLISVCDESVRLCFPNTNSGYGTTGSSHCTEESPLLPISLYGKTKCAAEQFIRIRGNYTVFRLATAFGMSPRMRWSLMVNDFVYRAVHDRTIVLFESSFRRNFIHVRDIANAFLWAIRNPEKTRDQVFNLGLDNANLTKLELAQKIAKHTECYVLEALFGYDPDKRNYFVSNEKIKKAGFEPRYSLEDGIDELIMGAKQYDYPEG